MNLIKKISILLILILILLGTNIVYGAELGNFNWSAGTVDLLGNGHQTYYKYMYNMYCTQYGASLGNGVTLYYDSTRNFTNYPAAFEKEMGGSVKEQWERIQRALWGYTTDNYNAFERYLQNNIVNPPSDQTDYSKIETLTNQSEKYWQAGNYKINYTKDPNLSGLVLSKVTSIVLTDADGNSVSNFKLMNAETNQQISHPAPGEEFYVIIPYNENYDSTKFELKFDFTWVNGLTPMTFTEYVGVHSYEEDIKDGVIELKRVEQQDLAKEISPGGFTWASGSVTVQIGIDIPVPEDDKDEPKPWTFEIEKIDSETKKHLSDAYFNVKIERSDTKNGHYALVKEVHECRTIGGKITIPDIECYGFVKFTITETKAPEGYTKLTNNIELIVFKYQGGNITYYSLNGFEDELANGAEREDVRIVNEPGAQKFTLIVENGIQESEFAIRLNKLANGKPLAKARFNFDLLSDNEGNIIVNYKATTNSDGIIFLNKNIRADANYNADNNGNLNFGKMGIGWYNLIIREEYVPSGYNADYYQIRVRFYWNGETVENMEVYTKTSEREREIENDGDMVTTLSQGKGIWVFVDNIRGGPIRGPQPSYEGYDIILNKVLVNASIVADSLEDINFDITMRNENGSTLTWNKTTSENGTITLRDIQMTGNITLTLRENLTNEQKKLYGIIGNAEKTIKFTATSEYYSNSRLTKYYVVNDSNLEYSDSYNGISIATPQTTLNLLNEITVVVKNTGAKPLLPMNIAGTVFGDGFTGKDGSADGLYGAGDELIENIEVTLLYADNYGNSESGNIVQYKENGDVLTNPIKTDENGKYEFLGLDSMRKYRVKFTYNGQDYEDSEYFHGTSYDKAVDENSVLNKEYHAYNTEGWAQLSKALEDENGRIIVNRRFSNIGDYPNSYVRADGTSNVAYSKNTIIEMYDLINSGNLPTDLTEEQLSMIKYIEDCKVSAYTDVYPAFDRFSISTKNGEAPIVNISNSTTTVGSTENYIALYDGQNQINFGLRLRPELDLRITDSVSKIDVHVNGKQETYTYSELADAIAYLRTFDIQRNKAENENGVAYYNNSDDLDVFVTHKVRLTNESETPATVTQLTEYYDRRYYTLVGVYEEAECENEFGTSEVGSEGNYNEVIINNTGNSKLPELKNNEPIYIYIKLQLNGNGRANASAVLSEDANLLENGKVAAGKSTSNMNYVEISGYSTDEKVGLVDRDSIAGSFNPTAYEATDKSQYNTLTYIAEDDTSGAQVVLKTLTEDNPDTDENEDYNSRTLTGNVFEDTRVNLSENGKTISKDAIDDISALPKIAGIKVELVEILADDTTLPRAIIRTDSEGNYTFTDYIPGNYVIRFTYGDTTYIVTDKDGNQTDNAIYNGQHYQSTYANPNTNATTYWYTDETKYSDAYDKVQDRQDVIGYANNAFASDGTNSDLSMNYYKTKLLKNEYDYVGYTDAEKEAMIKANIMEAYTSTLELEVEHATTSTTAKEDITYSIPNVDFGLVKRAESKMTLEQHLSHLTITKSDGSILVDTPVTIEEDGRIILESGSDIVHFQYISTPNSYGVGTAKLEIDDEILIGNIDLEYTITVRNATPNATTLTYYKDGENNIVAIGYYEEDADKLVYWESDGIRYYNDDVSTEIKASITREEPQVVTAQVKNIVNYVSTNLNYDSVKNGETGAVWELITNKESTLASSCDNKTAINNEAHKEYNQVLLAKAENKLIETVLVPSGSEGTSEITETLILSATNTQDVDLNYYNIAEILELRNDAGRVDAYSTPGNLNPVTDYTDYSKYSHSIIEGDKQEIDDNKDGNTDRTCVDTNGDGVIDKYSYEPDSSQAEHVLITDATGDTHYYYLLIGTVLVIFAAGVVLIKKFVLDKKA